MPSRSQIRTKGDERYCVGLGTTHGGHQNVVSKYRFDQQKVSHEEGESMRDIRHPCDIVRYQSLCEIVLFLFSHNVCHGDSVSTLH